MASLHSLYVVLCGSLLVASITAEEARHTGDKTFAMPSTSNTNDSSVSHAIGPIKAENNLPSRWRNICSVKPNLTCLEPSTDTNVVYSITKEQPICVSCVIEPGNTWNLLDLRTFVRNSDLAYAVTVRCHGGANISLQWPLRVDGLKYISVSYCLILDYRTEYFDRSINEIPDTLIYYSIKHSKIYVDLQNFMEFTNNVNLLTEASRCGPEKELMVSIDQNISYQFKILPRPIMNELKANLTNQAAQNLRRFLVSPIICNYTKLVSIDRSISKSFGANHATILLQNSAFPVLRVLNLSNVMLKDIPHKFDDWRLYFPRLKILDLSKNFIKEFHTVLDYGTKQENPNVGKIDLSNNNITTITLKQLNSLKDHKYVTVDIRKNPFICNCKMKDFVEHFHLPRDQTVVGVSRQYDYLRYLTCGSPDFLQGRVIVDLTLADLGCYGRPTDRTIYAVVVLGVVIGMLVLYFIVTIKYQLDIFSMLSKKSKQLCSHENNSHEEDRQPTVFVLAANT